MVNILSLALGIIIGIAIGSLFIYLIRKKTLLPGQAIFVFSDQQSETDDFTPTVDALPSNYVQSRYIETLPVGQKVYVTPWTVSIDNRRNGFISRATTYDEKRGGTVDLPIEKTENGDIIAYVSEMKQGYKWEPCVKASPTAGNKVVFK